MTAEPALPAAPPLGPARVILALMLREMGTSYGRSPGGYLWAILSPVGSIAMMAAAFSMMVHRPSLGTSFILFYATGYLPFDLFGQVSNKVGGAMSYSKALLAYPRVGWLDTLIARFLLTLLTEVTVFAIVIGGIMTMVATRAVPDVARIVEGFAVVTLCGLSMGLTNCLVGGYFPIWDRLWAILRTPLLFCSGVFFLFETLPPFVQAILWWNPLTHGIALMRAGFYPGYHADFVSLPYATGLPLVLMATVLPLLRSGYRASFYG